MNMLDQFRSFIQAAAAQPAPTEGLLSPNEAPASPVRPEVEEATRMQDGIRRTLGSVPGSQAAPMADNTNLEVYRAFSTAGSDAIGSIIENEQKRNQMDEAVEQAGLMARREFDDLKQEYMTDIDLITLAQGAASYYTDDGRFNNQEFNKQLDTLVDDPLTSAMMKGIIAVETSNRGPISESMNYSLDRAYRFWKDDDVDALVDTLPKDEQERIAAGQPSRQLGGGMMDTRYEGGREYRGRGFMQLTHRGQYEAISNILNEQGIDVDLIANPERITDPDMALPALAAYMKYKGMDADKASDMTSRSLNRFINPGADADTATDRWNAVIEALRDAGQTELADQYAKRDEYAAQRAIGTTVDGMFGRASMAAARRWAEANNVTIPEGASAIDVVELINESS